jgi:HAE1 family hydrophobic/amphiphilic exporter-1
VERVDDFAALPVARRGGVQLYVRDIAAVKDGIKERESYARYQGAPAVGLDIIKQSGTNTVEVADKIKAAVADMQKELPPGVNVEIVSDNSVYIRDAVNDVLKTILEGSLLAVTMVFLFLKDWRSTLISSLSIPISIIATFFAMKLMGFSINFLSLMALSLAVGLLIDDAIVVIENIVRHMRLGKTPLAAARDATDEIGLAVMATTFSVVAVFLPVAMMTGIVGQFFKQFGLTVVFSVLVSLLVSFTLVPLLASRNLKAEEVLPGGPLGRFLAWFNRGFARVNHWYAGFIALVLKNRFKTLALAFLLFFSSLAAIPLMGSSFIPYGDTSELSVTAQLDAGLSLDAAGEMALKLEDVIRGYPEVVKVYSSANRERVSIYVRTVDKGHRERTLNEIASDMRQRLGSIPGVQVAVNLAGGIGSSGAEKQVQFRLLGDDLNVLQEYAEKYQRIMEGIPGAVDVGSSFKPGNPEGKVLIDRAAATDLGISTPQVADTLRTLFNGVTVSQYEEGEDRFDVRVRLADDQRKNMVT